MPDTVVGESVEAAVFGVLFCCLSWSAMSDLGRSSFSLGHSEFSLLVHPPPALISIAAAADDDAEQASIAKRIVRKGVEVLELRRRACFLLLSTLGVTLDLFLVVVRQVH